MLRDTKPHIGRRNVCPKRLRDAASKRDAFGCDLCLASAADHKGAVGCLKLNARLIMRGVPAGWENTGIECSQVGFASRFAPTASHFAPRHVDNFALNDAPRQFIDPHPHVLARLQAFDIHVVDEQQRGVTGWITNKAY